MTQAVVTVTMSGQLCHQEQQEPSSLSHASPPSIALPRDGTNIPVALWWSGLSQSEDNRQDQACWKRLLLMATLVQEFPIWSKKSTVLIPQQPDQTTEIRHKMTSLIGIAKWVTTSSCSRICSLLVMTCKSPPSSRRGSFQEKKVQPCIVGRAGSQLGLCQIQRSELLKTPRTPCRNTVNNSLRTELQ